MANLQQTTGNLGADPEIIAFNNGGKVARFSIAENRRFTVDGQVKESTTWHTVNVYSSKARVFEAATKLKKGDSILVTGRYDSNSVEKDEAKTTYWAINANMLFKIDWSIYQNGAEAPAEDGDIPF
jgi:single-strand DNA-binding protein